MKDIKLSSKERKIDLLNGGKEKAGELKKALGIINIWVAKNVGGDGSKYLKMQKLLIIQTLSLIRSIKSP